MLVVNIRLLLCLHSKAAWFLILHTLLSWLIGCCSIYLLVDNVPAIKCGGSTI